MAYISTQDVAEIRANLKKAFPTKEGWKLSVRKRDHSEVCVTFVAGPVEFRTKTTNARADHCQVNQYYIADHWHKDSAKILTRARDIIAAKHWDESDSQTDYFHCAFYYSIKIGDWNKPYQVKESV